MIPESKKCSCGHDRDHAQAKAERSYGLLGWVLLLVGVSAIPTRVVFTCSVCDEVIDDVNDPAECDQYVWVR